MELVSKEDNLYWLAFYSLAESLAHQNYYKESIETYSKMIKEAPYGSVFQLLAFHGRASVYRDMEKYNKALADYETMLKRSKYIKENDFGNNYNVPLDVTHEYIYWHRAIIYENNMNDYDNEKKHREYKKKAIKEYKNAIRCSHSSILLNHFYSHRAGLYKEINEIDKAFDDYSNAIEICANNEYIPVHLLSTYEDRMNLYLEKGENEKAFEDYIKIIELEEYYENRKNGETSVFEVVNE